MRREMARARRMPRSSGGSSRRTISGSSIAIPAGPTAAEVAESVRTAQAKRWASSATRSNWSPRCDLYLYPTASPDPAGDRTAGGLAGDLDHVEQWGARPVTPDEPPRRQSAVPDHNLAARGDSHRPGRRVHRPEIPRWADEGIAVLAEPLTEQRSREAELQEPLESGRIFQVGQLMAMDYPAQKDWRLFYAQSVSLTRSWWIKDRRNGSSSSCATRRGSGRRRRCTTSTRSRA